MKQFIKSYWKTLLFFAIAGIIGGFFTGIFVLDSYPPQMQQQLIDETTGTSFPARWRIKRTASTVSDIRTL